MSIYDDSAADDVPVWEPQSQPMTLSEIAAEVGLSRDDIHQWMRVYSDFPKPLGLSGHDKTFDRAEVSAWLHKNHLHQYECANHNDLQTVRDMAEVIGMAPHRLATQLRRVPGAPTPMIGFDDTTGRRLRVYSAREVSRWIEQRFPGRYNTQQLFHETTAK